MRAPTRRSSIAFGSDARDGGSASPPRIAQRFGFVMPEKPLDRRGGLRRGRGSTDARRGAGVRSAPVARRAAPGADARARSWFGGARGARRRSIDRDELLSGQHDRRPGHHRRGYSHHRRRAGLARERSIERAQSHPGARGGVAEARGGRNGCRSGDAGGVQQSLHGDRRADGRGAAEHRLFGQHQGAAGFLLRAVRPRRRADRQRAAHAGASGLDGRERARRSSAARQAAPMAAACSRRRLCAQRAL